ncbi:MAG: cytochrome c maturation protein CcmE [Candidatus Kapaibacterium sp.]
MKKKYIIGGLIIIVFLAVAISSFNSGKIEYSDFEAARSGEVVQIIGSIDRSRAIDFNPDNNVLVFTLHDEKGSSAKVIYNGAKPNNFDIAPMLVVKGQLEGEIFKAREIYTKCPSKYEGKTDFPEN